MSPAPEVLTGRLRDIMGPILQMARLVYPECVPALIELVQGTDKTRRVDAPDSWEGRLVAALATFGREELIGYTELLGRVNDGVQDDDIMTARKLGWVLKHLGFEGKRRGKGRRQTRYVAHPGDDIMRDLCDRYQVPLETTETTEPTETGTVSNDPVLQ